MMPKKPDWPGEDHFEMSEDIRKLREFFNLPPLTSRKVNCYRCKNIFKSQFKGESQIELYCSRCQYAIAKADYGINI